MSGGEAVTNASTDPIVAQPPEMPGLISESGQIVLLQCVSDKHILAKIYPGNVLKIRDRRCKIDVVFDLSAILRNGRDQAQ